MKLAIFVLAASACFATAGAVLVYKANQLPVDGREADLNQPRHLVTQQMELETGAMGNRREPSFKGVDERGLPVAIGLGGAERPQFVLFIKTDCPCSIDAQPLFNKLSARFKGQADFVGVIDGDAQAAKSFASLYSAAFPIVPDSKETIIHGYQAKGGIYCALIAKNGHLIKMWPGYSADLLQEMNRVISQECAVAEVRFDPEYAPKVRAAGCAFSW